MKHKCRPRSERSSSLAVLSVKPLVVKHEPIARSDRRKVVFGAPGLHQDIGQLSVRGVGKGEGQLAAILALLPDEKVADYVHAVPVIARPRKAVADGVEQQLVLIKAAPSIGGRAVFPLRHVRRVSNMGMREFIAQSRECESRRSQRSHRSATWGTPRNSGSARARSTASNALVREL
jgi:hypothetical protein